MRHVLTLIAVTLLAALGWWFGARLLLPSSIDSFWVNDLYHQHEAIAQRTKGKRIFILAGSSSIYGYSAERIGKVTGVPTINFGVQAAMTIPYMSERLKRSLRPGDTVVLAFEPVAHTLAPLATENISSYAQFYDPAYAQQLPWRERASMMLGASPQKIINSLAVYLLANPTGEPLNAWGDSTRATPQAKNPDWVINPITVAMPLSDSSQRALADFAQWAKAYDITLVASWSPLMDQPRYHTEEFANFFGSIEQRYRDLGITLLGTQADFMLPRAQMFDTEYHADTDGRARITQRFLGLYCRSYRCRARP